MRWRSYLDTIAEHAGSTVSLATAGAFAALLTAWLLTPYAPRLLHRSSKPVAVAYHNQNDVLPTQQIAGAGQNAPDQSESSMFALSNDPTTTVIWLPNQP
jgi:hypothetical protein